MDRSLHPIASTLQIQTLNQTDIREITDIIAKDTKLMQYYLENTQDIVKMNIYQVINIWYTKK